MMAAALIPLVIAVLMALAMARRRGGSYRIGQVVLLAALTAGAAFLVLPAPFSSNARLVLIRDVEPMRSPDDPVLRAEVQRTVEAFSESTQHVDAIQVILLASTPTETPSSPCALSLTPWADRPADARYSVVNDPGCALIAAMRAFEDMGAWERMGDLLQRRASRILVQVDAPARWHLTDARKASEITDYVADAVRAAVRVDVAMVSGSAASARDPTLRIEVPPLVPSGKLPEDLAIHLILEHPSLESSVPPPGWSRECTIDPGLPSEAKIDARKPLVVIAGTGVAQETLPIGHFSRTGQAFELVPGFHMVACTVSIKVDGNLRPAYGQAYFRVSRREIAIVSGDEGAFQREGKTSKPSFEARLQRAGEIVLAGRPPWPAEVPTIVGWSKEELEHHLNQGFAGPTDRHRLWAPFALVLHDFPDVWYQQWCGKLQHEVEAGLNLIISGPPSSRLRGTCDFVPARALAVPGTSDAKFHVDRTPRVTVVLDHSRLGYLTFTPPGDDGALPPAQILECTPSIEFQRSQVRGLAIPAGVGDDKSDAQPFYDKSAVSDACHMWKQSNLEDRLARVPSEEASGRVSVGHLVVAFAYDLPQTQLSANQVVRLIESGASVAVVFVHSPFSGGLVQSLDAGKQDECTGWRTKASERVTATGFETYTRTLLRELSNSVKRPLWLTADEAQRRFLVVSVDPQDPDGAEKKLEQLRFAVASRIDVRSMMLRPNRFGRIIDERLGDPADPTDRRAGQIPRVARWAAPVVFEPLVASPRAGVAPYASVFAGLEDPFGLDPKAAAEAGPWGAGSVVVFGYSLFEGLEDEGPFKAMTSAAEAAHPKTSINPLMSAKRVSARLTDAWGIRRIVDVATFAAALEAPPGPEPSIAGLRESARSGRLEIEVVQQMKKPSAVRDFGAIGQCEFAFASNCTPVGGTDAALVLSRIDFVRQRLVYTLLGSATKTLCRSRDAHGEWQDLPACTANLDGFPFYLRNHNFGTPATAVTDLKAAEVLHVLARYTGGDVVGRDAIGALRRVDVSLRTPAAVLIIAALGGLWTWRLWRRVGIFWAHADAERLERRRAGAESAQGAVSAAGDALGRATTEARVGAFGGLQPMGPGDRLNSVVVEDLLMLSHDVPSGVPRVIRRIEEKARRVAFVVDTGRSMRVPGGSRSALSSKLEAAARVVELLGAMAWRGGAEVTVMAVADGMISARLGPLLTPPSPGAVSAFLASAAEGRGVFGFPLRLDEVDDGTTVIVISDYLSPDLGSIRILSESLEDARGALGGVHVFSRAEEALVDVGVAASSGLTLDRSELTPAELTAARENLAAVVETAFDGTQGGVCSIGAELTASEALLVLRESPLWGLFV